MTRPLEWQAAIRDHAARPASNQCNVLDKLALRLDWETGAGFCSVDQLAADAGVSEPTVRRALDWARGTPRDAAFFLARTRRGHRLGDGSVMASEWLLRLPSQPATRDLLRVPPKSQPLTTGGLTRTSTAQNGDLNRSKRRSQPLTADPPSIPVTKRPSTSTAAPPVDRRTNICRAAGHKSWECPKPPHPDGTTDRDHWCTCPCHAKRRAPRTTPPARAMTADVTVIETRRAGPGAGDCPLCRQPMDRGQRIAYIHRPAGHDWVHIHAFSGSLKEHPAMTCRGRGRGRDGMRAGF